MRGYFEKISEMVPRKPEHSERDYDQYVLTMDAICSRKPQFVKANCLRMLTAKIGQIRNWELRADAKRTLDELEAECLVL